MGKNMIIAVINAGGSGTRFWPLSRKNQPKQCLKMISDKSMILETVERITPMFGIENIYISTNSQLKKPIEEQVKDTKFIIEPIPKNTAACIGLSAVTIFEQNPEAVICFLPSDHQIPNQTIFLDHLKAAIEVAKDDKVCIIGINPTFPHTGLGYIKQGESYKSFGSIQSFNVQEFKEKPDKETAKKFLESGNYLWNAGMFISKAKTMLEEIKTHMPELYNALIRIKETGFNEEIILKEFEKLESIPIDTGIMEKSNSIIVLKGEFSWDDVGDFLAIERYHKKDENNNVVIGNFTGEAKDSIIIGDNVECKNIKELIIVDTKDSLLVCKKDKYQDLRKAVDQLENNNTLKKYTEDFVDNPEHALIEIDSTNNTITSNCPVVLIGVNSMIIEKNNNKAFIENQ